MKTRSVWAYQAALMVAAATLASSVVTGCSDDATSAGAAAGGSGRGGTTGVGGINATSGCGSSDPQAPIGCGDPIKPSAGGAGGDSAAGNGGEAGNGGAPACECTRDESSAHVPLECACAAGWCTTFEADAEALPHNLGWPFYLLLGTCEGGYRRLVYGEALESSGQRTYDASGRMVYGSFGPYIGVPEACGFEFDFGKLVIGEDPAEECDYCLLAGEAGEDAGASGAGGAGGSGGAPAYPELDIRACDPELLE